MKLIKPFLVLTLVLFTASTSYADVYPFEESYSNQPKSNLVADLGEEEIIEEDVVIENRVMEEPSTTTSSAQRSSSLGAQTITFKNFGTVMINLVKGIGGIYRGLFTEAFPSYGSDLVSLPAVTAELTGRMVEIERQALFEASAKQKEIDAYREESQRPLTPEQQQLLKELQAKQASN